MRKSIFVLACAIAALAMPSFAQTLSGLPSATVPGTTLNFTCPAPATAAQIWKATGNSSTVTLTSQNWFLLSTVSLTSGAGSLLDTSVTIGTTYGYTNVCTEGSTLIAPATGIYFGTPTPPLAAGTLSGTTS